MNLSDTQQRLYDKLRYNGDVPINVLFRTATRSWPPPTMSVSTTQQRLSPYLIRLRRKLAPYNITIVPGVRRGTYRLAKIDD